MMEKRVTDKFNPLNIDKTRDDLSLRFERLTENKMKRVKMTVIKRLHFLVVDLEENV
jgi:hypothetical protein